MRVENSLIMRKGVEAERYVEPRLWSGLAQLDGRGTGYQWYVEEMTASLELPSPSHVRGKKGAEGKEGSSSLRVTHNDDDQTSEWTPSASVIVAREAAKDLLTTWLVQLKRTGRPKSRVFEKRGPEIQQ